MRIVAGKEKENLCDGNIVRGFSFFGFCVVIITKVNMIKSQELVNFQGARPNGFLRVTFIYRK